MSSLIKFHLGPVQDFIAQARSTRDLWSGSYLLSWLVAAGIKALPPSATLIFPSREQQPLLQDSLDPKAPGILIPNLPNIFIAKVEGDAESAAKDVTEAIKNEWLAIAKAVRDKLTELGHLAPAEKDRFDVQVDHHLSIAWQATPIPSETDDAYRSAYRHNGWHLDAVRQTRDVNAWSSGSGHSEKDSLSGKEEALIQGSGKPDKSDLYHHLLHKHTDCLGAIALIKRVWHVAYLADEKRLPTDSKQHVIRSIPAIAARKEEPDDEAPPQEKSSGEKYIAAIAFDGDSIGAWVNGDKSPPETDLEQHHTDFSKALSRFAFDDVRKIVEREIDGKDKKGRPIKVPLGQLIYAGGDDVVCLVPADAALEVSSKLRDAFREATQETPSTEETPDASAGIAIAHIHSPLQDLIREAQKAEKRAKNEVGRPAFSITLMKRSGEISHWGAKWDDGGIKLHDTILRLMKGGDLSARFPHRVCQFLTPHLTETSGLSTQTDVLDEATARELITREFLHAARQQGSKESPGKLEPFLATYLDGILTSRKLRKEQTGKESKHTSTQELLQSVIGLSTAAAFVHRNRDKTPSPTAEKQPA